MSHATVVRIYSKVPVQLRGLNDVSASMLSIASASLKSREVKPPASWVVSVTFILLYTFNHSGWWPNFSATKAIRVIKPKASPKSLNMNSFLIASRSGSSCHPFRLARALSRASPAMIVAGKTGLPWQMTSARRPWTKCLPRPRDYSRHGLRWVHPDQHVTVRDPSGPKAPQRNSSSWLRRVDLTVPRSIPDLSGLVQRAANRPGERQRNDAPSLHGGGACDLTAPRTVPDAGGQQCVARRAAGGEISPILWPQSSPPKPCWRARSSIRRGNSRSTAMRRSVGVLWAATVGRNLGLG